MTLNKIFTVRYGGIKARGDILIYSNLENSFFLAVMVLNRMLKEYLLILDKTTKLKLSQKIKHLK